MCLRSKTAAQTYRLLPECSFRSPYQVNSNIRELDVLLDILRGSPRRRNTRSPVRRTRHVQRTPNRVHSPYVMGRF